MKLDWLAIHAVDHCNQKCLYCNNHAPFAHKKEYSAEDYFPHFDRMIEIGLEFDEIGISGGEPFLHSDLLGFVRNLKVRYKKRIAVATNLYWLKDGVDGAVFKFIDALLPSIYPHNIRKRRLLENITKKHHVEIHYREKSVFFKLEFLSEPQSVTQFCSSQANCTNLLTSGKLSRCATAAYADLNPFVSDEFLKHRNDIFFDLYGDCSFPEWLTKWPLDACAYCTLWKEQLVKWQQASCKFI